jgi:hypothetical protein
MTAGLRAHAAHWHRFGRIPRKCASMVGSGLTAVDWASGRTPQTRRVSSGTTDCAALWMARLDIVGVITLGMATAIGGGIIRDLLIGAATSHVQRLALLDDGHHGQADRGRAAQVAASADPAAHCARRRGAQPVPGDPGEQRPPTTDSARPKRSSWARSPAPATARCAMCWPGGSRSYCRAGQTPSQPSSVPVSRSPPSSAARTEWPRRSRQRRSASSSGCSASPNGLDAPDRAA